MVSMVKKTKIPSMPKPSFNTWCNEVVRFLRHTEGRLFQQAINSVAADTEETPPADSQELLAWMRSDEPEDTFEAGDDPMKYACFLIQEWHLFGPQGE